MQEMTNQELIVVVMPNRYLQLEWTDTKDAINRSSRLVQEEIRNFIIYKAKRQGKNQNISRGVYMSS